MSTMIVPSNSWSACWAVRTISEYEKYIDINEKGLLHILNMLRRSKSKARIVFPSTRLVYRGVKNTGLDENAEKEFKTIYALNKWFGEQVIQQHSSYFNLEFNIFRICVPYGIMFSDGYSYGTIGFFLKKAIAKNNIALFGAGDQKRTFTHIEDVCLQIYYAILHPQSTNRIFNVAGETFSLNEVAEKIAAKYCIKVENKEWPRMDEQLESGDTIFNAKRIQELIMKALKHSFGGWLLDL